MNILYSGDKNIEDGLIISIISLLKNTSEPLAVYVLTIDFGINGKRYKPVTDEVIDFLDSKVREVNEESFVRKYNVSKYILSCIPTANMETRFTLCCMLRLFADVVTDIPDKILYLDNDVICRKDPHEFYAQDISKHDFAGVLDRYGSWFFRKNIFKRDYVNSGVLLLNMKAIRGKELFKKSREMCRDKKMFMPDQSALNKLSNSKKLCPRRYNEQKEPKNDTVFQHFTTTFRYFPWIHTVTVKPWQVDKVHEILNLHEYDELLAEYEQLMEKLKYQK